MGRYGFPTKNQTHIAILLVGMLSLDCCFLAFVSDNSATLYSLQPTSTARTNSHLKEACPYGLSCGAHPGALIDL